MKKEIIVTVLYPIFAALIWGVAFVSQRIASEHVEPFTLNAIRSILAVIVLSIYLYIRRKKLPLPREKGDRRQLWVGGLVCGILLFASANLQQAGIAGTEAGRAGFITALYIVLVPLFGAFFGHKVRPTLWFSIAAATLGLYLLCGGHSMTLRTSDCYLLICAVTYAFYILAVDHYSKRTSNAIALSCTQFAVNGLFSALAALLFEHPAWADVYACGWELLYIGVLSSAVAYTLEFAAQQVGDPVTVTLLLCLESVFSVLAGAVIIHEFLSVKELLGCGIMLLAVITTQLPAHWWKRRE